MSKKKKIVLNKEIIANLNNDQMNEVQGGALWTLICRSKRDTCDCPSTPNNLQTCEGETCLFLDGCPPDPID